MVAKHFLICMGFISLQVCWLQKNNKKVIKGNAVLKGPYYAFISESLIKHFSQTVDSYYLYHKCAVYLEVVIPLKNPDI